MSPDGNAQQPGEALDKPTTLASAIERAVTGDAIVMRGGIYRTGGLRLNQGITIQPYADEQPVVKGTQVADKWERLDNGLWKTSWSTLFPSKPPTGGSRIEKERKPPCTVLITIWFLSMANFCSPPAGRQKSKPNTYFIDYNDRTVFIGIDPADHLVEITAFDSRHYADNRKMLMA